MQDSSIPTDKSSPATPDHSLIPSDVREVDVEPLPREVEKPVIPANRRLSWLGWLFALAIFIFNRKIGLVVVILLLVFRQYPTINLKHLPGSAGRLYRKLRRR